MRRRLILVRHAQAVENHPRGDHERVLTPSGVAAAVDLGGYLGRTGLTPGHVLVSTAVRAQQTLAALRGGLGEHALTAEQVWSERRIYDGGVDGVVAAVRETPAEARVLWVVGHEPVMSTTAWELSAPEGDAGGPRRQLAAGFPTATAAVLEVDGPWKDLDLAGATLTALHTGRGHEPGG